MKILQAQLMEPVEGPGKKLGMFEKFRHTDSGPLRCRAMAGMGLAFEVEDSSEAVLVPWANVKFARVAFEESDQKAAKK